MMTIKNVKEPIEATAADLSKSTFKKVMLAGAVFSDVNMSDISVENATLAGSRWNDVNLEGLTIREANLSGASIVESSEGMTIDGISVTAMMKAYCEAKAKA